MAHDKNLQAINTCISNTGQAMVFKCIDEHNKQALGIKNNLIVDENGQLYYFVSSAFEETFTNDEFTVELFFYKKGSPSYLTAKGLALKEKSENGIKVKVKVDEIDYTNTAEHDYIQYFKKMLAPVGKFAGLF
jgi:hypothetical protein